MKHIIVIITIISIIAGNAEAQTFDELFRQKKTQRKYLAQQIAALKVYLEYLKEGYRITKKGLAIVGDITDGNLSDHSKYFGSLTDVNGSLGSASLRQSILAYRRGIEENFKALLNDPETTQTLTATELKYVTSVRTHLLNECESSISWLTTLSTDETLEMRDDERIVEIAKVRDEIKDKYAFTKAFVNSTRLLIRQRAKEQSELERTQALMNSK